MVIKNGERTTGWAVAHDTVMANSPASLDLLERAAMFTPPLRTAIVAPLKNAGTVLGAIAAYTSTGEPFTDDHQYAMERIAAALVASPHCTRKGAVSPVRARMTAS